jgi:DNA-binding transcriptional MerR regulator
MERTTTEIPDKLFYKASEVCEITDTQPYVLRFWESEFPQLASEKNRSGQRVYRRSDIDLIFRIKTLLYQDEFTIAGARKAIDDDRTTIVEPPPVKSRARQAAPPPVEEEEEEDEEQEEVVVKPQRPADAPVQSPLFGEARPEAPEVYIDPKAQQEAAQYRQMYEDALATLNDVKAELARVSGHLDAVRERDRRIASRLEAALQS